jgi:hypothetical protein
MGGKGKPAKGGKAHQKVRFNELIEFKGENLIILFLAFKIEFFSRFQFFTRHKADGI